VLHPDDAAGARWTRFLPVGAPEDFLDLDAILSRGPITRQQLLAITAEHNPGLRREMFAESLSYLRDVPDREFTAYGAGSEQITRMRWGLRELG
jgi:hypothetical protein